MISGDYQKCLDTARTRPATAPMLDLNVDYVGRDGAADMTALATRFATSSTLPIMIDSTEPDVIQAGLEALRRPVRSELGQLRGRRRSRFAVCAHHAAGRRTRCRSGGADHRRGGQARTADHKVAIAERLITEITDDWGLSEDIIIDALTFPISTGQGGAPRRHRDNRGHPADQGSHPSIHFTLGISNISFGLNPAARRCSIRCSARCVRPDSTRPSCTPQDPADGAHPEEHRTSPSIWSTTGAPTPMIRCRS